MIASLPPAKRQESERHLPALEQAMNHSIKMQALMDLEAEKIRESDVKEARNHEIRVTPIREEQLKIVQDQEKMRKAMEMIEEVVGQ